MPGILSPRSGPQKQNEKVPSYNALRIQSGQPDIIDDQDPVSRKLTDGSKRVQVKSAEPSEKLSNMRTHQTNDSQSRSPRSAKPDDRGEAESGTRAGAAS